MLRKSREKTQITQEIPWLKLTNKFPKNPRNGRTGEGCTFMVVTGMRWTGLPDRIRSKGSRLERGYPAGRSPTPKPPTVRENRSPGPPSRAGTPCPFALPKEVRGGDWRKGGAGSKGGRAPDDRSHLSIEGMTKEAKVTREVKNQQESFITWCDFFSASKKASEVITSHDVLEPLKQALLALHMM